MIRKHNRRAARAAFAVAFGVAIILGGATAAPAAHDSTTGGNTPVIVGAKNFTEQYVLGQLYKQALEAKGLTVRYKENIGSTELIAKALTSGQITLYPEYTGVMLTVTFGRKSTPKTATGDVRARQDALGQAWLRARQPDALPGRRCRGRAPLDGDSLQAEDGRGPEEGPRPHARRLPGVRDAADRSRRHGPGIRGQRRRLPAAVGDQRLHAAGSEEGARCRRLLDRSPAGLHRSTSSSRIRRTSSGSSTSRRSCRGS